MPLPSAFLLRGPFRRGRGVVCAADRGGNGDRIGRVATLANLLRSVNFPLTSTLVDRQSEGGWLLASCPHGMGLGWHPTSQLRFAFRSALDDTARRSYSFIPNSVREGDDHEEDGGREEGGGRGRPLPRRTRVGWRTDSPRLCTLPYIFRLTPACPVCLSVLSFER